MVENILLSIKIVLGECMKIRYVATTWMTHRFTASTVKIRRTKTTLRQNPNTLVKVFYELIAEREIAKISPKYFRHRTILRLAHFLVERLQTKGYIKIKWAFDLDEKSTCRPDLIYISFDRLGRNWNSYSNCPLIPEIAIEIVCPRRSFDQLISKAEKYLAAGILQVWIINPQFRSLTVFSSCIVSPSAKDINQADSLTLYKEFTEVNRSIEIFDGNMTFTNQFFPGEGFTVDRLFS
jgi:Uma2 family endonuclease